MKNVLCFGDSNTFGFNPKDATRYDKNIRWTSVLKKLCENEFYIIEAGCNNRTAFSDNPAGKMFTGYKILPELCIQNIDVVIIAVGINDLQIHYNVSFDAINLGISNLIEIVKNNLPKAKIILVSPNELTRNVLTSPIFSTLFDEISIEKSKYLSKIYFDISKKYDCAFLDLNKVVTPSTLDGLHFEPLEHEKIAKEIFRLLKNI